MDIIALIIALSFVITLLVGVIGGKGATSSVERWFVGGRKLAFPVIGLALVGQAIDGNSTLVNTSIAFDFGFWAGAALPIGLALALFILGKWFAPRLNQMRLLTLVDFFEQKYNRRVAVIAAYLMLLTFGLLLAGNIAAVAALTQPFFGISYNSTVIIICLIVLLYVFRGGIVSDIYSDIFQLSLLVVAMIVVGTVVFMQINLGDVFGSEAASASFNLQQLFKVDQGAWVNWSTIIALGFGNILAIDFAGRIFSAKSAQAARRGCYIGGIATLVLGLPFAVLPLVIQAFGITPEAGVPILMTFGSTALPAVVYALLICGIIAASLSTIDGAMLSMGNILTHNLLNIKKDVSNDDPEESEKIILYFSRLTLIPIAFLAMAFAIALPTPGVLMTVGFDIMFAALLVPFLAAFYTKQADIAAALAAIVTGGLVRLVFAILTPTAFGVPNTFFYVENTIIPSTWDGVGTILAPAVAAVVYGAVVLVKRFKVHTYDPAH